MSDHSWSHLTTGEAVSWRYAGKMSGAGSKRRALSQLLSDTRPEQTWLSAHRGTWTVYSVNSQVNNCQDETEKYFTSFVRDIVHQSSNSYDLQWRLQWCCHQNWGWCGLSRLWLYSEQPPQSSHICLQRSQFSSVRWEIIWMWRYLVNDKIFYGWKYHKVIDELLLIILLSV